jgi:hypothetical protein
VRGERVESHLGKFGAVHWQERFAKTKNRDKVLLLVQTTLDFGGARWPCFRAGQAAVEALRARFKPDMSMQQYTNHVIELINTAQGSVSTRCYDGYQYCCQGIA